jgi:pantoate--beta-alanine ligase
MRKIEMMVVRSIPELKAKRREIRGSLGFVPTMGFLHEGHLSLVRRARKENDHVAVSIFVNPIQFLPTEDLQAYPRNEERDLALLEKTGTDLIFLPTVSAMYPEGTCTFVEVDSLSQVLEGAFRPGHFRGVATVVIKLFNLVEPTRAYFGQKDAQQTLVIKKMVADLNMNLEVVVCPTIREANGLAMSSRNVYLSPEQRRSALVISQALFAARDRWAAGERDGETLRNFMRNMIARIPGIQIDYVSLADPENLTELERAGESALALLAVRIGGVRLIDNMMMGKSSSFP